MPSGENLSVTLATLTWLTYIIHAQFIHLPMFRHTEERPGIHMYTADFVATHTVSMNVPALAGHFATTVKLTILRSGQLVQPMGHQSFVKHVDTSTMSFGIIAIKGLCSLTQMQSYRLLQTPYARYTPLLLVHIVFLIIPTSHAPSHLLIEVLTAALLEKTFDQFT